MADGYLFVEINPEGEARELDHYFFDQRVREYALWEDEEGLERLVDQLPESAVSDTHVFITFRYSNHTTYDSYNGEYDVETEYELEGFTVLQRNYKEFTRQQLTMLLASITGPDMGEYNWRGLDDDSYKASVHDSIADWEEFYDEDFKPFIPEPIEVKVNKRFLQVLEGGKD